MVTAFVREEKKFFLQDFINQINSLNSTELLSSKEVEELFIKTQQYIFDYNKEPIISFWTNYYNRHILQKVDFSDFYFQIQNCLTNYKSYLLPLIQENKVEELINSIQLNLLKSHVNFQKQKINYLEFQCNQCEYNIKNLKILNDKIEALLYNLSELGIYISKSLNINEVIDSTLDGISGVLDVSYVGIILLNSQDKIIFKDTTNKKNYDKYSLSYFKQGYWEKIINNNSTYPFAEDIHSLGEIGAEILEQFPDTSFAIISKIIFGDKFLGLLIVGSSDTQDLSNQANFINVITPYIASAIQNSDLYNKVNQLAIKDSLTDLFNRRYFETRFHYSFEAARRYNRFLSIIMIDIDHFKNINDIYGHQVGDQVLIQISKILSKTLRSTDIIARYGGEEIIILLIETPHYGVKNVAERIVDLISKTPIILSNNETLSVTISAGFSTFPDDARSMEELIEIADRGLYIAKNNGRNQVGYFVNT